MTPGRIEELTTDDEWAAAVPILQQLWSDRSAASIHSWRAEDGYRLFGAYDDELVAVAGVSIQRVLHHARHAWIHDLVVDEPHRSMGYGTSLVVFLEEWARDQDCAYLALAVRDGNDAALAFYRDRGLTEWGAIVETQL